MKILNIIKTIKEYQVSILIVFIIASILYGIHMFRYEYIPEYKQSNLIRSVYRVDRITNEVCLYMFDLRFNLQLHYSADVQQITFCDD